jgi:TPR repeat protein
MTIRENIMLHPSSLLSVGLAVCASAFLIGCTPNFSNNTPDMQALLADNTYATPELEKAKKTILKRSKNNASDKKLAQAYRNYAREFFDKYQFYDENSLELLQQAALLGDVRANYDLGDHYAKTGQFTPAIHWLKPAAHEYVPAKALLGSIFEYLQQGAGEAMINESIEYYKTQIQAGKPEYHIRLAQLYNDNNSPFYNGHRAFSHLLETLNHNPKNTTALKMLATIYREGRIVPRDKEKALKFTTSLAKKGNLYAMELLADAYKQGGWYTEKPKDALYWQHQYITQNRNTYPLFKNYTTLAGYYATGYGTDLNMQYAEYYYDKALEIRPKQASEIVRQLERIKSPHAHVLAKKYRELATQKKAV